MWVCVCWQSKTKSDNRALNDTRIVWIECDYNVWSFAICRITRHTRSRSTIQRQSNPIWTERNVFGYVWQIYPLINSNTLNSNNARSTDGAHSPFVLCGISHRSTMRQKWEEDVIIILFRWSHWVSDIRRLQKCISSKISNENCNDDHHYSISFVLWCNAQVVAPQCLVPT